MKKQLSPRYGRSNRTSHTASTNYVRVAASLCSALLSVREQYLISQEVHSFSCCSITHPTCESHASVTTIQRPVERGGANIGKFVSSFFNLSASSFSAVVKVGNDVGWSFRSFLFNCAATLRSSVRNAGIHCKGPRRISILSALWGPSTR